MSTHPPAVQHHARRSRLYRLRRIGGYARSTTRHTRRTQRVGADGAVGLALSGEYVSLGYYEKEDLVAVVEHLRSTGTVSRIGLWGRSMGAATSIMYGATDPSIACMVLDSPFSSLTKVAKELVENSPVRSHPRAHRVPLSTSGLGLTLHGNGHSIL